MYLFIFFVFSTLMTHINCDYGSTCFTSDQLQGRCMPVKSCKTTYELFSKASKLGGNISDNDKDKVRQLYCGTFKNVPHVCCPESEIQLNADGFAILTNNTCGVYSINRVSNGHNAALYGFPWMVLLKYDDDLDPFKCGGSLISDQYVLTAAHCIKGREKILNAVRLGEHQISTERDCINYTRKSECAPPVEDISIEEFILHENYHGIYNDIALIRLSRKVEFKRHIKPICLPIYDNLKLKEYNEYVIAGWGYTETGEKSDILQVAIVPKVERNVCEQQLRQYKLNNPLNESHLCAGGRGLVDTCRGDSGGPLGYKDSYNGRPRFIQFGIVAIGLHYCAKVNIPGGYTNVSYFMQWITDNVKNTTTATSFASRSVQDEEACRTPSHQDGYCVPYGECPFANEVSLSYGKYNTIPQYIVEFLKQSRCSRENEPVRLCCKINNYKPKQQQQTTTVSAKSGSRSTPDLDYTKDYLSQLNTQGVNILNNSNCGNPEGNRVVGGKETQLGEYPWMALLRYDGPGSQFKCGGSLITDRFVLTAAHCVNDPTNEVIGVRLGEHDLNEDPDCRYLGRKKVCNPPPQDVDIDEIIIHPAHSNEYRINDIALIKLKQKAQIQTHIKPVCLPITRTSFEQNLNEFFIAGWGATEHNDDPNSMVLLSARVFRKSRSVCHEKFGIDINQKHLCVGDLETGRDTCRGDSGGPLIGFNNFGDIKRYIQYGIVSAGGEACILSQKLPGLYTNIVTYMPWITSNIV